MIIYFEGKGSKGFQLSLRFSLAQNERDEALIRTIASYMDCGFCSPERNLKAIKFVCTRFSDIYEKIIPFFRKYPILGVKALDFEDFCLASKVFKTKGHLTREGVAKIIEIKKGMNLGREHVVEPSIGFTLTGPFYIYNPVKTILLFKTDNIKDLTDVLKIRESSLNKYLTLGKVYLGRFIFSRSLITTAKDKLMTLSVLKLKIEEIRDKRAASKK
jgi:hypothetical protein